jgi:hypothetical protein
MKTISRKRWRKQKRQLFRNLGIISITAPGGAWEKFLAHLDRLHTRSVYLPFISK